MKPFFSFLGLRLLAAGALLLCATSALEAQSRSSSNSSRTSGRTSGSFGGASASGSSSTTGTRTYTNSTLVGEATITSDPDTRRLIVITDEDTNEQIRTIVEQLDKPKPQVLINVVFVQVTLNDDLDFGIDATYKSDDAHGIAKAVFGAPTTGGTYQLTNSNIDATIHALQVYGRTEVLSRPSIMARSNQQASILVGQEVPFITNSRVDSTSGATINTVEYQDVGIILKVTPFITTNGQVEMIVSPEISSLSEKTVQISNTASVPVIDTRSADTVVVTGSDRTVVIGGLISRQVNDQDNKIPLLGDIPLLGNLFKRKIKSSQRTELLIFMTPHVLTSQEQMEKASEAERAKLEVIPNTVDKKELNKMLDKP